MTRKQIDNLKAVFTASVASFEIMELVGTKPPSGKNMFLKGLHEGVLNELKKDKVDDEKISQMIFHIELGTPKQEKPRFTKGGVVYDK